MGVLKIAVFENWNRKNTSTLRRVKNLFHKSKGSSPKENLSLIIDRLETTSRRLKFLSKGLQKRDQKFFEKCIEATAAGNHMRATLYANECAEMRKFAALLINGELALEQAALRLQTISKLGDVMNTMGPIVEIVEETKGRLGNMIPSITSNLNAVNDALRDSFLKVGSASVLDNVQDSIEASKILKEVKITTEESIRERFPRLPDDLETSGELTDPRIPIALTATGGNEVKKPHREKVRKYLKAYNRELNLNDGTLILDSVDFEKTILNMKQEDRINTG